MTTTIPSTLEIAGVAYNVHLWQTPEDMEDDGHGNLARVMRENRQTAQVCLTRGRGRTLYSAVVFASGNVSEPFSLRTKITPAEKAAPIRRSCKGL